MTMAEILNTTSSEVTLTENLDIILSEVTAAGDIDLTSLRQLAITPPMRASETSDRSEWNVPPVLVKETIKSKYDEQFIAQLPSAHTVVIPSAQHDPVKVSQFKLGILFIHFFVGAVQHASN